MFGKISYFPQKYIYSGKSKTFIDTYKKIDPPLNKKIILVGVINKWLQMCVKNSHNKNS